MAKRKQRLLQDLYNVTHTLSQPKITPILRENYRMQGPVDESDCDFHTNMVPPEVDKEYSSYSNNSKSDWRIESGTCNVCSAPCSSCLHINQHHMGSKVDECSGEASAENALSVSVNDAFPNDKIVKCETVRKSQTRNFVSKDSSNTSENVDSEATFRNSDLSATSSNITVLPKVEDPKGQEDHADHQSCVTGAEDTRLSNSNVRNGDSMDFPSYPVSANCLIAQEIVKTVCRQTSSGCLDMRCDFNESQNNFCRQSENIEEILKELPLSVCSPADLSSENLGLVETPVETAGGVTDFMKVQGSLSHPVLHKSPSSNPSGHLSSVSVMDVTSDSIHGDSAADYIGENECTDKIVGSRCLPTAKENSYEFHSMDESDDSDMVEDVKVCDICGDAGREDLLAICCRCTDGAEHTYCMREMVDKVPVGDWLCEECKFDVEMKNHMQEKLCSLDGSEKINSSGQANPEIANFSTKSEAKGSDVEGNRNSNDSSSMKVLGKRHSDDTEVSCAAKKRVLEPDISSAKISTTSGLAGISRDSSFKHLDRGKAMPTQISSSGTSLAPESESSPAFGSRLQTPQGTLIKSYSFNSLNVKPKVKLVDDVVPQKQRSVREHASLGKKEGVSRSIGKSMPFNVTNSARLSIDESKVKMLSPKFSHRQEAKGSKDTNDRNLFDRKNSFRSERLSGSPSMCKSGAPAANQKLVSSGEPNSLSSARSFHDTKGMQSDSRSLILSKSLSFAARRGSELPGSLGGLKRQSSASVLGVSSANGNSSHDLKPNQDSPNEDSSSSSRIAERSICNSIEGLPDGLSRPKEATNFGERANDSICSRSKQSSMISGRIISCQKCKEIGHSAQFCTADHPGSPVFDATAAKKLSDTVDGKDKLKAAIEAAVLRKPGIYRKHRVSDQSNDVSVSNINSEVATQDPLSDSSHRGNMSSSEEMQKKQMVLRSSVTESCEQETVDDDVKQFPVMSIEASTSITGHGNPVALLEGPSLVRGIPTCDSPSTLLRALAIPDHQYIWQGIFEVHRIGKTLNMFDGIQAHLSTSASPKVLEAVNKFAYRVLLNEVPRFTTWPVQFQESGVKEDNVALFFFAKDLPSYEKSYRLLLDNMMKNDLALKGSFDGFELMIFPSNQLPEKFQRWNTLFFLWGVFRGKRSNCSQHVPGSNKQICISHGIPTAIMSLPKNLCSLWPIDKGLAAGGRKALASEVAASELHCLSSSQALNEGCGSRVLSEVINNDPAEQPDNSSSFPFVQNSISKSCEATVHASNLCDERRHTSTSQEGGVDSDHNIEPEPHNFAECTRKVGVYKSQQMPMEQNSHLSRQHLSHYFGESSTGARGIGSVGNMAEGNILDKMSSNKCQVSLEDGLMHEAPCATGNQIVKDNYRNCLHVDTVQRIPKTASANSSQVKPGISAEDISVEEVSINKKQKTDFSELYGANDQTNSFESLASQIHGVASGSLIQANRHGEAFDGTDVRETKGNAERYFFPVDPHPKKDVGLVGRLMPWKMNPSEEDQFHDRAPNLELALGAETKPMTQGGAPQFSVGKEDKEIVQANCSHEAAAKGDEDDVAASLSLSLSFPFPDMEQTVKSLSKTEQLVPEKRRVNTSLLLLGGSRGDK